MYIKNLQRRNELVIKLLTELKNTNQSLALLGNAVVEHSEDFYEKIFNEYKHEIQKDIEKYNNNIEAVSRLNNEVTTKINEWYNFIRNPENVKKITYPLRFTFKRNKLQGFIKHVNSEISKKTIENRFIKETLSIWEHQLESRAVQLIRQGEDFVQHTQLISKKDEILNNLKYLLPTIYESNNICLDMDNFENLIEELSKKAAL